MANPFEPTFGASPPVPAGRERQIADFVDALDDGPGAAGRATLYTGTRGSGKTVMLNAIEDEARSRRWLVVSETANESPRTHDDRNPAESAGQRHLRAACLTRCDRRG
jgi:hypothetical protein